MVGLVPTHQKIEIANLRWWLPLNFYTAAGYLSSKSEVPEGNEGSRKRIVSTYKASVSINMLRVTPSSALSVKVILQIT